MPRDAFGREPDDDTLGSLGWGAGGDTAAPPARTPPVLLPDFTPSRRRGGGIAALVGLVVATGVVWLVIALAGNVPRIHLPKIDTPDIGASGTAPAGLDRTSLLRHGNLAPALRKLEAKLGGRVRLVRIEAERIDVQVVSGGRDISAQWRWDGDAATVISDTPSTPGQTFSWSQVNASAPARLVRATTKRGRDFEYAVLIEAAGLRWSAYTATSGGYLADSAGRAVRPIGG